MKNKFNTFERHSSLVKKAKNEMRHLWVKVILIWLLNAVFALAILCGVVYLLARVVMFAIGQ